MGQKDALTNEYMSDCEHFADIFNFFLYDGRQVIDPGKLKELDRTAVALPYGDDEAKPDVVQKYRDVFKMLAAMEDDNAAYLLLGVEDQEYVHYAMPVRNMLYDAAQYSKQVEQAAKKHRKSRDVIGDEFLSGFKKNDKLIPVITLVIYWSPNEWNGPKSIHEMLSVNEKELLRFVPDYEINLITPRDIDDNDFRKFHTTLAEALQFIKYSKRKTELKAIVDNDTDFERLDRRTVELINEVTGADIKIPESAKEVNVCQAIRELEKDAADKSMVEAIKNLMETMKWTAEQAMNALKIKAEDQSKYIQML